MLHKRSSDISGQLHCAIVEIAKDFASFRDDCFLFGLSATDFAIAIDRKFEHWALNAGFAFVFI